MIEFRVLYFGVKTRDLVLGFNEGVYIRVWCFYKGSLEKTGNWSAIRVEWVDFCFILKGFFSC